MLSKLLSHARHNVVAYLALFFALTGVAYAAGPLKSGDPAGGDLTGTYPNPTIADGAITGGTAGKVADGSLTDTDVATANKDGTVGTPSLRTLGTGAQQAMPGDATPGGPPTGSAGGGLTGTYPNPTIAGGAIGTSQFSSTIPTVRASGFGAQSIPDSADTVLDLPVENWDSAALHNQFTNTSRLTAPVAGVYNVTAQVFWHGDATGYRQLYLKRNGSFDSSEGFDYQNGDSVLNEEHISSQLKLAAGSYIELAVNQHSGAALSADAQGFAMSWVAPG